MNTALMVMPTAFNNTNSSPTLQVLRRSVFILWLGLSGILALAGCAPSSTADHRGPGPGGRNQNLGLNPQQELELGEQAYREILSTSRIVSDGPDVERVKRVGKQISRAVEIDSLQREMNLRTRGFRFNWEFNVLRDRQINAFCLPGGKVVVFSGLFAVVSTDAQLAAVMAHEVAHALAHHTSERLARQTSQGGSILEVVLEKAHDREQESEADHIGLFLMTFAGYDPEQAVIFWEQMRTARSSSLRLPEILSDHPSDSRRVAQMGSWIAPAKAAKRS